MSKSHGRKSRARNTSRSRGAAYAAANAGTLHQHDSGPSNTDLQPGNPGGWGVDTAPDMRTASALIGACLERCAPCQQSLAAKLLAEDPIVLAVTAGSVYSLLAADEQDAGSLASGAGQVFFRALKSSPPGDGRSMVRCVELLSREERSALLEDALDLWMFFGHKHPGLMRAQTTGQRSASPFTFTVPGSDPEDAEPGTVLDLSGLAHPARYGVRADMTLTGFGRVASVALVPDPESPEAGYEDLHERLAWEPYIPEGLPEEDPAWVLKVHETNGTLLGIVRLLDATLLPDSPREWRPDAYDVILWSAPEPNPVSAAWLETARERGSALLYGPLDLAPATPLGLSRLLAVHARCVFTDRL
ncbi:hypothetical protein AB5J52_48870 (plasmid) [Streptomyces sp. R39]|uniref:GNAT family N-acetyltransferase n=1 Tax=Streptomyces sp. R39 TaxID=3238631 RepID=A0AB39R514_9ACTN